MFFGYCRVSTKHQSEEGNALERYREQLLRFGVKEDNIFFDIESGATDQRKGYQDLLGELRKGMATVLVFPSQSRLARDVVLWTQLSRECQSLEIQMFALDRGRLDIGSSNGIFTNAVMAANDEYSRRLNQEHAIKGHQFLRDKKIAFAAPFGYRIENGKPVLDEREYRGSGRSRSEVAREGIDLFLVHQKPRPVMRAIKEKYGECVERKGGFPKSSTGFYLWLQSPTLRGTLVYRPNGKEILHAKNHEPLIDLGEWNAIARIIELNRKNRKAKVNVNPLAGFAFCGVCGGRLHLRQSHSRYFYLVCADAASYQSDRQCQETQTYGLRLHHFVDAVTDALRSRAEQLVAYGWQSGSAPDSPEVMELRSQIEKLEAWNDPDLATAIDEKRRRLNQLIEQAIAETASSRHAIDILLELQDTETWESATYQELADIFRETIDQVVHLKGAIEVKLKV
jgi:site-specific DNA recombinase